MTELESSHVTPMWVSSQSKAEWSRPGDTQVGKTMCASPGTLFWWQPLWSALAFWWLLCHRGTSHLNPAPLGTKDQDFPFSGTLPDMRESCARQDGKGTVAECEPGTQAEELGLCPVSWGREGGVIRAVPATAGRGGAGGGTAGVQVWRRSLNGGEWVGMGGEDGDPAIAGEWQVLRLRDRQVTVPSPRASHRPLYPFSPFQVGFLNTTDMNSLSKTTLPSSNCLLRWQHSTRASSSRVTGYPRTKVARRADINNALESRIGPEERGLRGKDCSEEPPPEDPARSRRGPVL